MSDRRLPIFPTRMNQSIVETKLRSAEKGYNLLKKKSDALQLRYRNLSKILCEKKEEMYASLNKAYYSMSQAEYLGASLVFYINDCRKRPVFIETTLEKVSGVSLPIFKLVKSDNKPLVSLGRSGRMLMKCRDNFLLALELLVDLCTVQNSFKALDKAFNSTNRRVNSLEFLLMPIFKNTLQYVFSELEEQEREDFYRLKKIQNIKKERIEYSH